MLEEALKCLFNIYWSYVLAIDPLTVWVQLFEGMLVFALDIEILF